MKHLLNSHMSRCCFLLAVDVALPLEHMTTIRGRTRETHLLTATRGCFQREWCCCCYNSNPLNISYNNAAAFLLLSSCLNRKIDEV